MNKIRVCVIMGNATRGGVESYVYSYCLQKTEDFDFTFVYYEDSWCKDFSEIESYGIKTRFIPNVKNIFKFNRELNNFFKKEKFDIVHSYLNTLSGFPLKIAEKNGIPVRISHASSKSSNKEPIRNLLKTLLKRKSRKYATHYFAVTKEAGEYQFGKKNLAKVKIVLPYVEISKYRFDDKKREEYRNKLSISKNDFVIGNVGRLCKTKNQMFLIEILRNLVEESPKYKLVIIGDGNLEAKLRKQISKYKLNQNVKIINSVDNVQDYYNTFDLFAFPSLYEGFGLVIPESQANGLSFVASKNIPTNCFKSYKGEFVDLSKEKWVSAIKQSQGRLSGDKNFKDASISNKNALFDAYFEIVNK